LAYSGPYFFPHFMQITLAIGQAIGTLTPRRVAQSRARS
jgi:hypothetical protein